LSAAPTDLVDVWSATRFKQLAPTKPDSRLASVFAILHYA